MTVAPTAVITWQLNDTTRPLSVTHTHTQVSTVCLICIHWHTHTHTHTHPHTHTQTHTRYETRENGDGSPWRRRRGTALHSIHPPGGSIDWWASFQYRVFCLFVCLFVFVPSFCWMPASFEPHNQLVHRFHPFFFTFFLGPRSFFLNVVFCQIGYNRFGGFLWCVDVESFAPASATSDAINATRTTTTTTKQKNKKQIFFKSSRKRNEKKHFFSKKKKGPRRPTPFGEKKLTHNRTKKIFFLFSTKFGKEAPFWWRFIEFFIFFYQINGHPFHA